MNDYYYSSQYDYAAYQVASIVLIVIGLILTVILVARLVCYIFRSVGLYTIAKRRGIHHPWLAWIPLGQDWITGSISDQYEYLVRGKFRSLRKWLLVLGIVSGVLSAASGAVSLASAFVESDVFAGLGAVVLPVMWGWVLSAAASLVSTGALVVRKIAMYDLFRSCSKENAVLFLVLGILLGVTEPFLIFAVRKRDDGMPPRRTVPLCDPPVIIGE